MPEQPLFGYKMHLAVDQGSGLVRRAILTPAHVSDKAPFLALVQGDERTVYADRGYDGWWYRRELAERGVEDGIMAGSYRQRPLDAAGHARNRALGRIRAPVERTFAILKRHYGYTRVRYRRLVRNALQLQLLALAMNLRRALVLSAEGGLRLDHGRRGGRAASHRRPHAPSDRSFTVASSSPLQQPRSYPSRTKLRHNSKLPRTSGQYSYNRLDCRFPRAPVRAARAAISSPAAPL